MAFQDGNVWVYLVECSCQENTNLLHPAGGGDGPAQDQNTRLAQVLKEQLSPESKKYGAGLFN